MPVLTVEQSKLGGQRSVEARHKAKQELEYLRARVAAYDAANPPQPKVEPRESVPELLTRTREQLDSIDKQLAKCADPKDWDCLTRSRERNFRIWAHLAGIPGAGNLKPTTKPTQSRPRTIEPQAVVVVPVEQKPNTGQ